MIVGHPKPQARTASSSMFMAGPPIAHRQGVALTINPHIIHPRSACSRNTGNLLRLGYVPWHNMAPVPRDFEGREQAMVGLNRAGYKITQSSFHGVSICLSTSDLHDIAANAVKGKAGVDTRTTERRGELRDRCVEHRQSKF